MKTPRFLPFFPILLLLAPLSRWLAQQHDPHFLLGLSSSFWAGVAIGVSIVGTAVLISLVVLQVHSARAAK